MEANVKSGVRFNDTSCFSGRIKSMGFFFILFFPQVTWIFSNSSSGNAHFLSTSCSFSATFSPKYPNGRKQPPLRHRWEAILESANETERWRQGKIAGGRFDGINDPVPVFCYHSNLSVSMLLNIDRFRTRINHLCLLSGSERVRVVSDAYHLR